MKVKILKSTDYAPDELEEAGIKIGRKYKFKVPYGYDAPYPYYVKGKNDEYYPFGSDEVEVIED